jgi:cephalosporin hydroxylase
MIAVAKRVTRGFYANRYVARFVTKQFHRSYYYSAYKGRTWQDTHWLGTPVLKSTADLWAYQELICELRPDVIIECGSGAGGSALYFASICDLIGHGGVLSIDDRPDAARPQHARIVYVQGSSIAPETIAQVRSRVDGAGCVLVILDSDHAKDHVLSECRLYSEFVTLGSYLIVEDTNINGHPVMPHCGAGPMEAVDAFLAETDCFVADRSREKFLLSFNPRGFLRRVKPAPSAE